MAVRHFIRVLGTRSPTCTAYALVSHASNLLVEENPPRNRVIVGTVHTDVVHVRLREVVPTRPSVWVLRHELNARSFCHCDQGQKGREPNLGVRMNDRHILVPLEPSEDTLFLPGDPTTCPEDRQRSVRVTSHDHMVVLLRLAAHSRQQDLPGLEGSHRVHG